MTYQMMVRENLFLGADMLYEQRGYKSKTFYELIAEDGVATITYQYLSTPIKVGYQTRGNVSYYSSIGIVPAFLLRANHHFPWDWEPRDLEVTDLASDFDLGGLIEIGANVKINEVIIGFLQLAYQHSFTTVSNSDYFADSSVRNFGISLTLGVKFGLD